VFLKKIEYSEFSGLANAWSLKELLPEKVNLLVGKNAIGKTRTISVIARLGNMFVDLQPVTFSSVHYYAEFVDSEDIYKYYLDIEKETVRFEKLLINGDSVFERSEDGAGELLNTDLKKKIRFQVPLNKLVVSSKRDAIQTPYLEKLYDWVNKLYSFWFAEPTGKFKGYLDDRSINSVARNLRDTDKAALSFETGVEEFGDNFRTRIVKSMKEIGYDLTGIESYKDSYLSTLGGQPIYLLSVTESDRLAGLSPIEMSQGMFRALSLLIQLVYCDMKKIATTILIDDIGEGLDFYRSSKLIQLSIDIAEKNNNIQLIMSTNDEFVMNVVPLQYWQVIQRTGGECKIRNYQNSKEQFENFKFTGLSNFDLLTTDYLNQPIATE
jgi:AAA15 family ATPase/GTPase